MKILIVEDEEAIARGLKFNFEQEGYSAEVVYDGRSALEFFENDPQQFQLVVLDLMLPGMSGYETCRQLREIAPDVPVLVLSARTLSEDRTLAFDVGTDQYMTKPFNLPELLSRVRNLLNRHRQRPKPPAPLTNSIAQYEFDNVRVDFSTFEVRVGETVHVLTTIEAALLQYFVANEGKVLSRARLLSDVWDQNGDVIGSRTVDNFVMRLRRVIEENPAEPRFIVSVRGTGYRFLADPENASHSE